MSEQQYLIWSHQHNAWWRAGGWGYTRTLYEAGRYTEEGAADQLRWDRHREWLEDGKPHEVIIAMPTVLEMRALLMQCDVLDAVENVLRDVGARVLQATNEAIDRRGGHLFERIHGGAA